jgi:hypothetical protein
MTEMALPDDSFTAVRLFPSDHAAFVERKTDEWLTNSPIRKIR